MIQWSAQVLADPAEYIREQTRRMQTAASELRFEVASKIKAYIDELSLLGKGPFRYAGRLQDFQYLCFQYGPKPGTVKVFLILKGQIEQILCVIDEMFKPADVMRIALTRSAEQSGDMEMPDVERIGIVANHLFTAKNVHGVFSIPCKSGRKIDRQGVSGSAKTSDRRRE